MQLPADRRSVELARELVSEWLTEWNYLELIAVAGVVATVFVANVLAHTDGPPSLRVESAGTEVTVAVEDASRLPAELREDPQSGADIVSGLAIVSALCRAWGTAPTPTGKTVWPSVPRTGSGTTYRFILTLLNPGNSETHRDCGAPQPVGMVTNLRAIIAAPPPRRCARYCAASLPWSGCAHHRNRPKPTCFEALPHRRNH
jgi:hypothetical protein